jgi:hypothetical protein
MPRSTRRVVESPESRAVDEARRAYDKTEALLERQLEDLKTKAIVAILAKKLSIAEAARRVGYSREHMSKVVSAHLREHPEIAGPNADDSAAS